MSAPRLPGHEVGTYLGSVKNLRTLRERCVVGDGCWHLRTPRGRPMKKSGAVHQVWVHGVGKISAARAAWLLAHGALPENGLIVYRTCESYDCVLPTHLAVGTRREWGAWLSSTGRLQTLQRRMLCGLNGGRSRKLTREQVAEVCTRTCSVRVLGAEMGVSPTTIASIRNGTRYRDLVGGAALPASSVWALGTAA